MARGALAIETREIEISIGAGTLDARVRAHTPAYGLIEELMILANRRVAELIVEAGRPALHRVHEPPDASSIAVLLERLEALGVPTPSAPALHGGPETARYAGLLSRAVMRYAAREGRGVEAWPGMVLRAVQKARYDPLAARAQRARRPPLLPFHVADPPLSRPGLPPRAPAPRWGSVRRPPGPGLADVARTAPRPSGTPSGWSAAAPPSVWRSCSSAGSTTRAGRRRSTARSSASSRPARSSASASSSRGSCRRGSGGASGPRSIRSA